MSAKQDVLTGGTNRQALEPSLVFFFSGPLYRDAHIRSLNILRITEAGSTFAYVATSLVAESEQWFTLKYNSCN